MRNIMAKSKNPQNTSGNIRDRRPFGAKIASFFDQLINQKQKLTRSRVTDYIPIAGVVNSNTYFDEYRNLVSVFKIIGNYNIVGAIETDTTIKDTISTLSSILRKEDIQIQITYLRDKQGSERAVEQFVTPLKNKADSLGLDLDFLIDEDGEMLKEHLVETEIYVAVITSPLHMLSKDATKDAKEELLKKLGPDFPITLPEGMQYYMEPSIVLSQHQSNVESVRKLLENDWKTSTALLSLRETLKLYRRMMFPDYHTEGWEPVLPLFEEERGKKGGRYLDISCERLGDCDFLNPRDLSHLGHPSLKKQLAAGPIIRQGFGSPLAKIGNRFTATQIMTMMPQTPKSFDSLLVNMPEDIPIRFSITLFGGADKYRQAISNKRIGAYITSIVGKNNLAIAKACDTLTELQDAGVSLAGVSVQMATWAPTSARCHENLKKMTSALERWGNCQTATEFGDPALAFTAGLPGWTNQLRYVLVHGFDYMLDTLPYKTLTSPWSSGSMAFLNEDNKLFLYQPISDKQQTWSLNGFAPPGGGKSVWLNCLIRAAILDPTQVGFTKVCAVDIGNSLRNAIRLYKKVSRTEEIASHFQHMELEFSEKYRINLFDLYAGCQMPLTHERTSQESLLAFILTDVGESKPIAGSSDLIKTLLTEVYQNLIEEPRLYDSSVDAELKQWAENQPEAATRIKEGTITWWTLEQLAIAKGDYTTAKKIHRYVVPTMRDVLVTLNRSKVLESLFKDKEGQSTLVQARRMIQTFIATYPSLCKPSAFNFDMADICVIDLDKISKDQTPMGRRQTALGYIVARNMLSRGSLLSRELLKEMPETAIQVYKEDIERLDTVAKYFLYDELHRSSGIRLVEEAIEDDQRTGRKFNRFTGAFSQLYTDFTPAMSSTSTVRVIMRVDKEEEAREIADKYGWNESTYEALRRRVRGASGKNGASFLMNATSFQNLPHGAQATETTQVLRSFVGPTSLACYSTNRADAALLAAAEDAGVPYEEAVKLIGKIYGGSINSLVKENMIQMRQNKQTEDEEAQVKSIIAPYVKQILNAYYR